MSKSFSYPNQIPPNASGRDFAGINNNLKVIIDYTDTTGERRSVEKNVQIQFRNSTGTARAGQFGQQPSSFWSSKTFYFLIIVAIACIGVILYRKKTALEKLLGFIKKK